MLQRFPQSIFQLVRNVTDKGLLTTGQSLCILLGSNETVAGPLLLFFHRCTLFPPDFLPLLAQIEMIRIERGTPAL